MELQITTTYSLLWSTYWGGSGGATHQFATDVKCNSMGNLFVCGFTRADNFPVYNQPGNFIDSSRSGVSDGYLAEFNTNGVRLWSTYFGGGGEDQPYSLDFDSNDNFYVTGWAHAGGFPLDSVGGAYFQSSGGDFDAFITKFDTGKAITWSTMYGGGGMDWAYTIKVDANDNVFVHGGTRSNPFPCKNPGGIAFVDSVLGDTTDDFIVKFNSSGSRQWATLIGGSGEEGIAFLGIPGPANRIAFDSDNNIYIIGTTMSNDFPLKHSTGFNDSTYANRDGYIMQFNGSNFSQMWSSYISGAGGMELESIVINSNDKVIVGGATSDSAFYLHQQANLYYQDIMKEGTQPAISDDACILAFDSQHNLIYGTYFGGYTGTAGEIIQDMALNGNKLYLSGMTTALANDFPLYNPGHNAYYDSTENGYRDVFISQLCIDQLIGIDEVDKFTFPISLFPNPTSTQLTLQFDLNNSEKITVAIYNSIGQTVFLEDRKGIIGNNRITINSSNLNEGFYFIDVQTESGHSSKKFIKLYN